MGKYKSYPEYKDSNIVFLGDVPCHWTVGRFKFCTARVVVGIAEAATQAYSDSGVPIIRSTNIKEKCLDTTGLLFIKESFAEQNSSKYLYENDIVTIRTGFPGISAVVPKLLDKSQCFTNLISTPKKPFRPEFLTYLLNSAPGKAYFELLGWGSAQKNISVPILQDFPVAYPLFSEQTQIANFLDHETAKIDTLIEKQQQLIKLLKEKRQAVISHAVTKGLNPDAPMKDSGVEWLGNVPKHWVVSRIKNFAKIDSGHTPSRQVEEYWIDCNIPWVSLNDSKTLKVVDYINDTSNKINELGMANSSAHLIPERAVVFTRDASIGLSAIISKPMAVSQHLIAWICNDTKLIPEFLLLIFYAMEKEFERYTFGATIKTIGMDDVRSLSGAFPPLNEQRTLVEWAFQKMESLKKGIEKAESVVELLKERRTALISAAVTGKIDVRDWQPAANNLVE